MTTNTKEPFDLLEMLKEWVTNEIPEVDTSLLPEASARHRTVNEAIERLVTLSITIPDELTREEAKLREMITLPDQLKPLLTKLQQELTVVQQLIDSKLKGMQKKPSRQNDDALVDRPRALPKQLKVTFADGKSFCRSKASETLVAVLDYIGLERVAELTHIVLFGHPIVSSTRNPRGMQVHQLKGYYIETSTSTDLKARDLERIASELHIPMKVEVL